MERAAASPRFGKGLSTLMVVIAYGAALGGAFAVTYALRDGNAVLAAFLADCAATLLIFLCSVLLNNSSMYDPYWSFAPLPLGIYWLYAAGDAAPNPRQVVVLALVAAWGARLTYNWYRQWQGLSHEDWRYAAYRTTAGRLYWVVSFFGFHFFPTVMVFLGSLPLYTAMRSAGAPLNAFDLLALIVTGGAIIIEAVADRQLHDFVRSAPPRDAILSNGLWAYSRHPNYFGEISFWWGLFLFALAAGGFPWWAPAGALAITVMFVFVSIPLYEKRMLAKRPHFAERRERVSALVPWFPKRAGDR